MHPPLPRLLPVPLRLRPATAADLPALFEMQLDPDSNEMAGTKPRALEAFLAAWQRHLDDTAIRARVIEIDGENGPTIIGSISCFQVEGRDHIGYWIARAHWGRGLASRALGLFLREEPRRPLHATTSRDNERSRRILEKYGFRCTGFRAEEETERFLAREIAEFVLS